VSVPATIFADHTIQTPDNIARPPFSHLPVIGEAARPIALGLDAVNTFWDRRVLGYTAETQHRRRRGFSLTPRGNSY